MKKLLTAAGKAAKSLGAKAVELYRRYPARANTYIASAVVFAAGVFGVVLNQQSVLTDVALVIPILIGGEATHRAVSPTK
jgi:hypothetical protein